MLSRARDCQIIIGNKTTLEQARGTLSPLKGGALWKKIFSHLESRGQIFRGLPVTCQNHGTQAILTCPQDFVNHCRHGGCMEKCMKERECDHPCQMFCHPGPCPDCCVMVPDVCTRGHPLEKQCSSDSLPKCKRLITWTCPMGHPASGPCFQGKFGTECGICIELRCEEDKRMKREEELNQILSKKHESLTKLKNKIEIAKQSKARQEELQAVEAELLMAQKELDGFLSTKDEVEEPVVNTDSKTVLDNVLSLLQKQNPVPLSTFPETYKREFGSIFADDVDECMLPKQKKRRKLKDILMSMPFCEVISNSSGKKRNQYDVCLRDDYNRDSKLQKVDSVGSDNDVDSIETVSVVIGDARLEYTIGLEESQPSSIDATHNQAHDTTPSIDSTRKQTSSILPPMPSKSPPLPKEFDDVITHVLNRYTSQGALKADDLLDELKENESVPIVALRFLIELELYPGSSRTAPGYKTGPSKLANAVCLTAKAMDFQSRFPLQARECAQAALSLVSDQQVQLVFPKNWVNDLKAIGQSAVNPKQTSKLNAQSPGKSINDAWLEIKQMDPKAPEVMSDSVLPMIGLNSVKQSLIGMYHRFQLAKEQGDGAASSYNIRFEGNPG